MHNLTQLLINTATNLGGAPTTKTVDAGYLTTNVYGVPHKNGQPQLGTFTATEIEFPTPIPFGALTDAAQAPRTWTKHIETHIRKLRIYDHPELTPAYGEHGDGIMIAQVIGCGLHLNLTPNGVEEACFG